MNPTAVIIASCVSFVAEQLPQQQPVESDSDHSVQQIAFYEPAFYDCLDVTFRHLCAIAYRAYVDHFRDEPGNLGVVHYYLGRLAVVQRDDTRALEHFRASLRLLRGSGCGYHSGRWIRAAESRMRELTQEELVLIEALDETDLATEASLKELLMLGVLIESFRRDAVKLEENLRDLGADPQNVLSRLTQEHGPGSTAKCPLYDPELLRGHVRLAELKAGAEPLEGGELYVDEADQLLPIALSKLRAIREEPESRDLSMRKFLDRNRKWVWVVGWLYRCRGVKLEHEGNVTAARENYMRAWAIGDSLFTVSERGKLDRFDPFFLAELGDVYARLGRYDLMLRYMYSDQGLPAQFEMAKPIAELARVAESVRLARHDESAGEQLDEVLPETVSQLLFEQPVMPAATTVEKTVGDSSNWAVRTGWVLIGVGGLVFLVAVASRLIRANRRTALDRTAKTASPLMNSPD